MSKKKVLWQNRIVGYGEKAAKDFKFNPNNWRVHSDLQRGALGSILSEVGWVTGVVENLTTGNLLDGHARIEEALKLSPETLVPFLKVELTETEEKKILALLDPIGAMATTDSDKLQELFEVLEFDNLNLADVLEGLLPVDLPDEIEKTPNLEDSDFEYENKFGVIVECESELHQQEIFNRLQGEGLKVKVVVV